jgi:hypothetical protein
MISALATEWFRVVAFSPREELDQTTNISNWYIYTTVHLRRDALWLRGKDTPKACVVS